MSLFGAQATVRRGKRANVRRDLEAWMWAEACEALARAERLHRQFFRWGAAEAGAVWEPPVDIFASED